jgi:diacylglycerol O-acyltransferase-1
LCRHEGRRFSPAFTEAIAWVLHVVFSIAVPIAAAICVCNASEPAPLFAMGFMGTCITLVLKLSNFAVHQWHCRTLARSPSTTSRPHTFVSIPAFAYFLIAPTLNFALEYPSGLPINPFRLARRAVYLAVMLLAMGFVISQMLEPLWSQMVAVGSAWPPQPLAYAHLFLKLALPVFLVWLGAFIAFFHLWLGMLAESTGFGDRRFFLDWWNAPSMKEFWSRWNLPVHHWALSSVQAPLKRFGTPPKSTVLCWIV